MKIFLLGFLSLALNASICLPVTQGATIEFVQDVLIPEGKELDEIFSSYIGFQDGRVFSNMGSVEDNPDNVDLTRVSCAIVFTNSCRSNCGEIFVKKGSIIEIESVHFSEVPFGTDDFYTFYIKETQLEDIKPIYINCSLPKDENRDHLYQVDIEEVFDGLVHFQNI